jgi:6-pyruvoyltetrahydropterin/6-carboxytetrahydropterin synthase
MTPTVYSVIVRRELIAQHYLVGGDFGRENDLNSHRYRIEARYEGEDLDEHGFLVDIDDVQRRLARVVERYQDRTLNDFPEFADLNPSVENFARLLTNRLAVDAPNVAALEVTVWEDDSAAGAYRKLLGRGVTD